MAQSNSATSVDSCSSTDALRRNSSNSNLGYGCSTIYTNLWKTLLSLTADPNPQVREVVKYIVNSIKLKVGNCFIGCSLNICCCQSGGFTIAMHNEAS